MNKDWQHGTGGTCTFSFVARYNCQEHVGKGHVNVVKFVAAVTWLTNLVVWLAANLIPLAIVRRLCLSYRLSHDAHPSAYVYE